MNPTENAASNQKNYTAYYVGFTILALFIAILSSLSSVRKAISWNDEPQRKILGKVFGEFGQNTFVVFKIKTESGIEIEIYEKDSGTERQKFKQKFSLPEDLDAYLMVNNTSVNIGLSDVDKDGSLDIVAPTVDRNGNSRLNVFRFNSELVQFVPVTNL